MPLRMAVWSIKIPLMKFPPSMDDFSSPINENVVPELERISSGKFIGQPGLYPHSDAGPLNLYVG